MSQVKNYVMISPNFPDNFQHFVHRLNERGIRVLGIGDGPYDNLSPKLKNSLTEYYYIPTLEDDDLVKKAITHFQNKYGPIDRLESHNEHWLELDARMRSEFDIPGIKNDSIEKITHKSKMKEVFRQAGVKVPRGGVAKGFDQVEKLVKKLGYPAIVKPDRGMGASDTWKIKNKNDLAKFKKDHSPQTTYKVEEFIQGDIVSFDGLTDQDGKIAFYSYFINAVTPLDIAMNNTDMYYYAPRQIPQDLIEMGTKAVEGFRIPERFFHIEFFKTPDDQFIALELNCRPPGGYSLDMMNYANDIDIYAEYANIVKDNSFHSQVNRPYNACYISRKDEYNYVHSSQEVKNLYQDKIVLHEYLPLAISDLMGNEGFIVRTPDYDQMLEMVNYILAKNQD